MKNVLIIEDNKYSMEKVTKLMNTIPDIVIIKAENSEKAYKYALEYTVDLFVVDIILDNKTVGDISGERFVENIRNIAKYKFTPVIFTTCMEDPKLYAYAQLHCYGYFEKPYNEEKFINLVKDALQHETVHKELEYYCFKQDGMICPVKIKNIVYFENKIPSLNIHCSDGDILSVPYKSSNKILLELNSPNFVKCNRHIIINRRYIKNIDTVNRYVTLTNGFGTYEIGQRMVKRMVDKFK